MLPYEAHFLGYHYFIVWMAMIIGDIFASFMSEWMLTCILPWYMYLIS